MRTVPGGIQTTFESEVQPLAFCVRVEREDGTVLCFTSLDKDLEIPDDDGTVRTYVKESAIVVSAATSTLGDGVDNQDAEGVIDSELLTERDLYGGLYRNARLEAFIVNFEHPEYGRFLVQSGYTGGLLLEDGRFRIENRGLGSFLNVQVGKLTSPLCRCKALGDACCKVDLASYQFTRTVSGVSSTYPKRIFDFGASAELSGYFSYGRVIFLTGENAGIAREVKTHTLVSGEAEIVLQEGFPFAVELGDTATVEAGCDRRFPTCIARFANAINFHGEPNIPGTDELLKIPRP